MSVHYLTKVALREGVLIKRDTCSECGSTSRVVAHHDDYSKPMEVRWLCAVCHMRWHGINGQGKNREHAGMNPRPKHYSKVGRNEEMQKLADGGMSYKAIGDQFGITRERVRQILGNRKLGERRDRKLEEAAGTVAWMRLDGKSFDEISQATGLPKHWLSRMEGLPDKSPPPITHGTRNSHGYRGCKCVQCRKASADYARERFRRLRSEGKCIWCQNPSETWICGTCKPSTGRKGKPPGKSGVRGVNWSEGQQRWNVVRYINGKQKWYGSFRDLEDAKKRNAEIS